MRILLSFTGFHDPYCETGVEGEMETGPILTVIHERPFDSVILFVTPVMKEKSVATLDAISRLHPKMKAEVVDIALKDPTNYTGLLRQIRLAWADIRKNHPDAEFTISVSSGTPHMHASWLLLAASGEIPANLVQSKASKFARAGTSRVTDIDFTRQEFPQIRAFPPVSEDEKGVEDAATVAMSLGILGDHEKHLASISKAVTLGQYDEHVLITGETGTGKEMVAKLIHQSSHRVSGEFVCVNCAGFSESLIESLLFGHRRGAFTGADRDHTGFFETARGGTLFLDEIGELPLTCQAKLLRALEQRTIHRVGDNKEIKVDVRVIAATNRDVKNAVRDKTFREDLYYRFGEIIQLAPLRERKSDIPKLALHFLDQWNGMYARQRRISTESLKRLLQYDWPGNIRELRKVVERSARLADGKIIQPGDLIFDEALAPQGFEALPEPRDGFHLNEYCAEVRRRLVDRAIELSAGNKSAAARLLGVTPQAVHLYVRGREDKG